MSGDSLDEVAAVTGGQVFATDRFDEALAQIATDNRSLFRVGYVPPAGSWDGKYHPLKITTANRDLRIHAIGGYYAEQANTNPAARLAKAALGAADGNEIGLRVAVTPSTKVPGWAEFSIRVNPAGLGLESDAAGLRGRLSLTFAEYETEWQPSGGETALPIAIASIDYASSLENGLLFSATRGFAGAARRVRIVVQDPATGATGSVTIPASAWAR